MVDIDPATLDPQVLTERALELRGRGYNCAQAVACAFAPLVELDPAVAFRLSEAFGSGMGGMTETCGAIAGAAMVLGQRTSIGPDDPTTKARTYKPMRALVEGFAEKNGTTVCRELKGVGVEGGPRRSCPGCIEDAVHLLVKALGE